MNQEHLESIYNGEKEALAVSLEQAYRAYASAQSLYDQVGNANLTSPGWMHNPSPEYRAQYAAGKDQLPRAKEAIASTKHNLAVSIAALLSEPTENRESVLARLELIRSKVKADTELFSANNIKMLASVPGGTVSTPTGSIALPGLESDADLWQQVAFAVAERKSTV